MKSTRYCTSGQASDRSRSICCSALVVFSFDCSRYRNARFQLADRRRAEAAAHQADRVDAEDPRRPVADRPRERQRVLGHDRVAADEGMPADAAELVHARAGADVGEVLDRDVAAERRHVAEDRVVADVAVVRDVHVGHEQVAVADRRHAAAAARAAMDRDELAEDVAACR